jgi:hypothetical protein
LYKEGTVDGPWKNGRDVNSEGLDRTEKWILGEREKWGLHRNVANIASFICTWHAVGRFRHVPCHPTSIRCSQSVTKTKKWVCEWRGCRNLSVFRLALFELEILGKYMGHVWMVYVSVSGSGSF